jgi:hypothetical protein
MYKTLLKAIVAFFFFATNALTVNAQDTKLGTWGIVTVVMPGDSAHRWGGYTELQTRTNGFLSQFQYYEAKIGVSYDIDKNFIALLGTGTYHTFDYHDVGAGATVNETRFWEQMTINQYLTRQKF